MMSSMALGMAQAAIEDAIAYAKSREQFGAAIIKFQAVQFMLADMSTDIAAARLLIHHAARLLRSRASRSRRKRRTRSCSPPTWR